MTTNADERWTDYSVLREESRHADSSFTEVPYWFAFLADELHSGFTNCVTF